MARGKAKKKEEPEEHDITNPETAHRKRLKALALSNNMLSEIPARSSVHLNPSSVVIKHHGKDIIKKSQRKSSRYLFSFPGLIAPVAGGKIGELKDLGTKNPILYLDFPQGQMKLFGTIVYPKNRYLTLQFPKGGKSVMCEDYFDNMVGFVTLPAYFCSPLRHELVKEFRGAYCPITAFFISYHIIILYWVNRLMGNSDVS